MENNYSKYRGKCKEMCEKLVEKNPDLTIVRGYYHEPIWNTCEQHYWCKDSEGKIIDPTKKQFPSGGIPEFYEEFDGYFTCEECGKRVHESEVQMQGKYPVCSYECAMKLVGLL